MRTRYSKPILLLDEECQSFINVAREIILTQQMFPTYELSRLQDRHQQYKNIRDVCRLWIFLISHRSSKTLDKAAISLNMFMSTQLDE